jgi:hypothetical protein
MAGFRNFKELVDAEEGGNSDFWSFRKSCVVLAGLGSWFDFSMSQGNPIANYYAATPMTAAQMSWSNNNGIRHGGNVAPAKKFLKQLTVMRVGTAGRYLRGMLCDYLLYYPFCDMSETDEQELDNTVTLSRYVDGVGVRIMPVIGAAQNGNINMRCRYTNCEGVAGLYTPWCRVTTSSAVGLIATTQPNLVESAGPFLPLNGTCRGVRAIESVQFQAFDVGLITLVLVRPLCNWSTLDATPCEVNFPKDNPAMPQIMDDAYLNLIACAYGTAENRTIHGNITTVWN